MTSAYVHGYSAGEGARLADQATTLTDLLHADTRYPDGAAILEAGCGVGAQTAILAANNPRAAITAIDISEDSLAAARRRVSEAGHTNVTFRRADIFALPFPAASFDHLFVCFVLEHLPDPVGALWALRGVLKPGGTITVIEGDHGSTFFHPDDENARRAIGCLVALQQQAGGDPLIGRRLYPLLTAAGYGDVAVSPRMVYVDGGKPNLIDGFTRKTFTAMVAGVRDRALDRGLIDAATWDAGIAALHRTAAADGTFCYTFFKAIARR